MTDLEQLLSQIEARAEKAWDFQKHWEYQQGALFLKSENSGLEWKKSLAEFFFQKGQENAADVPRLIAALRELSQDMQT